jgi:phosphatidylglycerol lysyltransferase
VPTCALPGCARQQALKTTTEHILTEHAIALDQPVSAGLTHADMARRVALLKQFGSHSMSFSTMQPGMSYFEMPGIGYIAYAQYWGMKFTLADPVCAPQHRALILDRFVERYPNAVFVQVTKPVVDHLHRRHGFYGTQFGSESKIDLATWSLRGSKKQIIRTAINQARNQGIEIREGGFDHDVKRISEAWIRTRRCKNNEIRFLIRPMIIDYREGTRYFYAFHHGEAAGFIFFDPIYRDGTLAGYVPNISRSSANFKQGLWYALMAHAIETFKEEGVEYIDLGLVPLMMAKEIEPQESCVLRMTMSVIRERMDFLYNFKGLEFAKSRFQRKVEKTYCCHRNAMPAFAMTAMFRLTRII